MYRPIENVLPMLANVRQSGPDRWIASCPTAAHERGDKHPSLGIRECPDGVVLLRCYSLGCTAAAVTDALGLALRDLFPGRVADRLRAAQSPRVAYRDLLLILQRESFVAAVAAQDAARHLRPGDSERAMLAATRIRNALECAGVKS